MQGENAKSIHLYGNWMNVGISLHFTSATLNNIESTCRGDVERCCKKMLTLRLEGHVQDVSLAPVTWKTLLHGGFKGCLVWTACKQPDRLANQSWCSDATTISSSIHSTKYRYNVVMIMWYAFIWSGQSNWQYNLYHGSHSYQRHHYKSVHLVCLPAVGNSPAYSALHKFASMLSWCLM